MKTSFVRSVVLGALLAPACLLAAAFEGKVNLTMTSGGKAQPMTYSIKGDKVRIDMAAAKGMGGMILDPVKKQATIVMDEQKMYMTMAIPDATPAPAAGGGKSEEATFEKTGETEKILGYTATKFLSTHQGTTTELWLAEGIGTFMSFAGGNPMGGGARGGAPATQPWESALAGKQLFPLRVVGRDKSGKESFRMEATAVQRQSLPDSHFAPPAGYQKFDMGNMMQGMMPGRPR